MAISLAALGLLAFLLGCPGTFAEPQNSEPAGQCSLTGTWKSDLSVVIGISSVNETGLFNGTFYAYWLPPPYYIYNVISSLHGIQHQGPQPTFVFISDFFPGTTNVFVGQCLVDENGKEKLRTTWVVFEKKLGSAEENWKVIWVGRITFYRIE